MTLHEFLNTYVGNDCISIYGYCEECNQKEIMTSNWYNEVKNKKIKCWQIIGGGMYKVENCITLDD